MATNTDGIHIGLDLGTSTIKTSGTYLKHGKYLVPSDILLVQNLRMVPAAAAYLNGKFYWGQALMDLVAKGDIPVENVMRHYKVLLHEPETAWDTEMRNRLVHQLAVAHVPLEDFYVDIFTHLVAAIRERVCESQIGHVLGKHEVLTAAIAARIALPQSFSSTAARILTAAAGKAGIGLVNITSEQICALAAYLDNVKGELPFSEGDALIFVDAGCFTVDSVLYLHRGGQGSKALFEALAKSHGSIFGSLKVNLLIKAKIEANTPGGMQNHYTRLGLSAESFNFQLLDGIETAKKKFNPELPDKHLLETITISNYTTDEEFSCRVTQRMARDAFDVVFDENCQGVDALLQQHVELARKAIDDAVAANDPARTKELVKKQKLEYIVLSGGGCQCSYMRKRYKGRYNRQGITIISVADQMDGDAIHVAKGALSSRYDRITPQPVPLGLNYALLEDQVFQFPEHRDCWYTKGGRRVVDKNKVRRRIPGSACADRIVIDRLRFLGHSVQIPNDVRPVAQIFFPNVADRVIKMRAVTTDQDHLKDNDAGLNDDHDITKDDNQLRESVKEWTTAEWVLPKDIMESQDWKVVKDINTGHKHYQHVKVTFKIIRTSAGNMTVKAELILPKGPDEGKHIELEGTFVLHDPRMCEFVSDADAGRRPHKGVDADGDSQMA